MDKKIIENHFSGRYHIFYEKYVPKGLKKLRGDEHQALCPFHPDTNPSLSVNDTTGAYFCHGCGEKGGIFRFYAKLHGLDDRKDFPKILDGIATDFSIPFTSDAEKVKPRLVATYDYCDESGNLLSQVCRTDPKGFRQRKPNGNGGWDYKLDGVRRVPYRLPEVINAPEVIIVEGEKDADNLVKLGFTATTNPGGAGKWRKDYNQFFAGKGAIILSDNDEPGRMHGKAVAASLYGTAESIKIIDLSNLPPGGDVSDFISRFNEPDEAVEALSRIVAEAPLCEPEPVDLPANSIQVINAATWLASEPPAPDQILECVFDTGDKFAIIGSSKLRKSFFLLMLVLSLAAGINFFGWVVPQKRRVLLAQLEIKAHHFHRRVKRMAHAMGITSNDLGDRLQVINARGLGISGPEGIERIRAAVEGFRPEVIVFDPLYKVSTGVENAAEDTKVILNCFDQLAEQTGAAVGFVHHDPKGSPGDRDIRDRGAGSNVLGRDYDACITLTAHAQDPDSAVVEILLRNYRPQEPFAVTWTEDENGGYRFEVSPDILPDKKTSRTKPQPPPFTTYLPMALSILGDDEMEIAPFKASFKEKAGLSDHRIRDFLSWATSGGKPHITTRETRGYRTHEKWLRTGRQDDNE